MIVLYAKHVCQEIEDIVYNETIFYRTRHGQATAAATEASTAATPTGMELELPVDPNEPTYCRCNQVSYGEMVACDNPNVCDTTLSLYFQTI